MRIIYIPRKVSGFTGIKYGALYNWYAAVRPQTVEYGYLYNWYAATDVRKISSSDDWVVPTSSQMVTLRDYLGGDSVAGGKMKESGTTYWNSPNTGADNSSGFNGRGAGLRSYLTGAFSLNKSRLYIWGSDNIGTTKFGVGVLVYDSSSFSTGISTTWVEDEQNGLSIRLLYTGAGTPTSYIGNDGHVYPIVQIGSQYWVAANLMETKYRNGDAIPEVTDNSAWAALTTGARCAYNNTITNVGFGNAITSSDDWVVPALAELVTLREYLGGASVAGGKLKETGLSYWLTPNTGATNESGFNGRGCGYRNSSDGSFNSINTYAWLISTTEVTSTQYGQAQLWSSSGAFQFGAYINKGTGSCIRLLYTGAGTPTSYTGNDGKKYRVITIGTQTWLADNLAETKYRDGSYISGYDGGVYTPISNATWAAKTTEAMCIYGDVESNMLL